MTNTLPNGTTKLALRFTKGIAWYVCAERVNYMLVLNILLGNSNAGKTRILLNARYISEFRAQYSHFDVVRHINRLKKVCNAAMISIFNIMHMIVIYRLHCQ